MSAPAFDFRSRRPGSPLGRYVATVWYARGHVTYDRERIAPTGSTVAIFVLGSPLVQTPDNGGGAPFRAESGVLVGPHNRPLLNQPEGETHAVGIVTTPVGCEATLGVPPTTIRGRAVDLGVAWPDYRETLARLREAPSAEDKLDVVEQALTTRLRPDVPGIDRCEEAVALLEQDPRLPISELADRLGVAHGHLDREMSRVVGLTPASLGRLLRMCRLLAQLDVRADVAWAELAQEWGWYDQAHLIRDFKRHTGVSPTRYIAAQRAEFSADEVTAGFVPERG